MIFLLNKYMYLIQLIKGRFYSPIVFLKISLNMLKHVKRYVGRFFNGNNNSVWFSSPDFRERVHYFGKISRYFHQVGIFPMHEIIARKIPDI